VRTKFIRLVRQIDQIKRKSVKGLRSRTPDLTLVDFRHDRFYVYVIRCPFTKDVLYVGKGIGPRMLDIHGRSNEWQERIGGVRVVIDVYFCADEEEAFELEAATISELRPQLNVIFPRG
jgi:hypothetical protein